MRARLSILMMATLLLVFAARADDSSTNGNNVTVEGLSVAVAAGAVLSNPHGATLELAIGDRATAELREVAFTGILDPVFDIAGLFQILAQLLDPVASSIPRTDVTGDRVVDAADVHRRSQLAD